MTHIKCYCKLDVCSEGQWLFLKPGNKKPGPGSREYESPELVLTPAFQMKTPWKYEDNLFCTFVLP
jgi:hypothetical protein